MTELTKQLLSITPEQKYKGIWFWKNGKIEFNKNQYTYNTPKSFTGFFKEWYSHGQISVHSNWENGEFHGEYKWWHRSGQIWENSF